MFHINSDLGHVSMCTSARGYRLQLVGMRLRLHVYDNEKYKSLSSVFLQMNSAQVVFHLLGFFEIIESGAE
jgi:hypothetical protein